MLKNYIAFCTVRSFDDEFNFTTENFILTNIESYEEAVKLIENYFSEVSGIDSINISLAEGPFLNLDENTFNTIQNSFQYEGVGALHNTQVNSQK